MFYRGDAMTTFVLVAVIFSVAMVQGAVPNHQAKWSRGSRSRGDLPNIQEDKEMVPPVFTVDLGLDEGLQTDTLFDFEDTMPKVEIPTTKTHSQVHVPQRWFSRTRSGGYGISGNSGIPPYFMVNWGVSLDLFGSPWWEGPNVCPREEASEELHEPGQSEIQRHHLMTRSTCDETPTAFKCTTEIQTPNMTRKETVVYECCHGFHREAGQTGCPKEIPVLTMMETLDTLGAEEMLEAVKGLAAFSFLQDGNYTIFAPSEGLLENIKPPTDTNSNVVIVTPNLLEMAHTLEDKVAAHIVEGFVKTAHLEDEELLPTLRADHNIRFNSYEGPKRLLTANCRPITSSDNVATNGVVHVVDGSLSPVHYSIADIVSSKPDLSMMKTVIGQSGLLSMLRGAGDYTLLAPSNTAFSRLDPLVRDKLLSGEMCLEEVVKNHILPHVACSAVLDGNLVTLNVLNNYLRVSSRDDKLFVEEAQMFDKDIMATNGVIHIIDEVLIPSEALSLPDVMRRENASIMLDLVQHAGLLEEFTSLGNFTAFVPNDLAFNQVEQSDLDALRDDPLRLRETLRSHVLNSREKFDDLESTTTYSTLAEDRNLKINTYQSVRTIFGLPDKWRRTSAQCALITRKDIGSCGGVTHVVDRFTLLPEETTLEILRKDPKFSRLVTLLNKTTLEDTLTGRDNPLTVFAPTNDAFDSMDTETLDFLSENPDKLKKFLQYHMIEGAKCCPRIGIYQGRFHQTSDGNGMLMLSRRGPQVYVNHVPLASCDSLATNGIVHALDSVLQEALYTHVFPYMYARDTTNMFNTELGRMTGHLEDLVDSMYSHVFGSRRSNNDASYTTLERLVQGFSPSSVQTSQGQHTNHRSQHGQTHNPRGIHARHTGRQGDKSSRRGRNPFRAATKETKSGAKSHNNRVTRHRQ